MRFQDLKLRRQVLYFDNLNTGVEAQSPRSAPGSGMKVDLFGKQVQFAPDSQSCVVDIQFAKSGNRLERNVDEGKQAVEITRSLHCGGFFQQNGERPLEGDLLQSALMRVPFATAVEGKRRIPDCRLKRRLARKPAELGARVRPDDTNISAND